MSWLDQGRQEHGWFGHGTAPTMLASDEERTDPRTALYEPVAFDQRIVQTAYGAVGALPRKERGWYEHSLHLGGLDRLRRAMPVWARGALLDEATFHQTFFGPYDSRAAAKLLQSAAREAATAYPRIGLRQPVEELAGAVQTVGIYNWPPFLARSAQRADAVMASGDPRIIRVGTLDLPGGLLAALGIAVTGAIMDHATRTEQDRSRTASPTPPAIVRQDTPESAQQPERTDKNQGTTGEQAPAQGSTYVPQGARATGENATVSPDRRRHILDGDGTGGGHRADTGAPGKTAFPADWSDDKVIEEVKSVANDPASARTLQPNGRLKVEGSRDGIDIRVIINPDGKTIRTAHPINTPRNP
jgi:hypothetical protein